MRILHISTTDLSGGAARAAWNLVEGLREIGCDARMLVKDKRSSASHVSAAGLSSDFTAAEDKASLVKRKLINPDRSPVSNTWFSLSEPGCDLAAHEEVQQADLLHLHWVSGFLSPGSIRALQQTGKPIVWTLHDQRPFTGACHFSAGCTRFERDCTPCALLKEDRWRIPGEGLAESLRQIRPEAVEIVCPSYWMADCAKRSVVFKKSVIHVVPYGIDTSVFFDRGRSARSWLDIGEEEIFFLAGADQSGELRKGLHLLDEAFSVLSAAGCKLPKAVLFGSDKAPEGFRFPVQCVGRIESQEKLAELYSAADAFLLTSTEDNLPNTMLESLCCGTPVIGLNIGGVPDAVVHLENGLIVQSVVPGDYAGALSRFCSDTPLRASLNRERISRSARQLFSIEHQAKTVRAVYEVLLKRNNASSPGVVEKSRSIVTAPPSAQFAHAFTNWLRQARKEQWRQRWRKIGRKLSFGHANSEEALR